ncbi:uncharacterized protein MYCFIDRAFT_134399 [Pseudocercospora fijiensis CIRAD86]|uniref:G-patch domain-containing protein n=1 Tax=Pseudocercospora fijiensis (strain CIRAD86) TaxID=383855 RepID=M2Z3K6_PSEFD|nr:uncharacterized protein MYCFIDRAFT_134399 [Pseudocercospora fijiensis CIRAD86]EME84400.1 hypothetical protein MYCFIDRAFT_134399 [Pseudocercospora fijiensis CIRAD86]
MAEKRKFTGAGNAPHKAPKLGAKGSFAAKMMAKMGWKEGEGLGMEGEGVVNPIEVKLRPQGAGVGAVKELTEQYKEEKRRAAEKRGEQYEDSSEEERKARRERKKKSAGGISGDSGASTPSGPRKPKTKYKTAADVRAAAPGLHVPPQMLSSIVDATGAQTKLLTSAAGLMTASGVPAESEAEKIAKRERLELEAFIEAWHGVQEQKAYIEEHAGQQHLEAEAQKEDLERLQGVLEAIEGLRLTTAAGSGSDDVEAEWTALIAKLEDLQNEHKHEIEKYDLQEAAVGALFPLFKKQLASWSPLEDPTFLASDLACIKALLGLQPREEIVTARNLGDLDESYARSNRQKATTAYETLIYTIWLPKLRTTITNWDVLNHTPLTSLVQAWRPLLPPFIYSNLMDVLIVPKLSTALTMWDPRKRKHHHKTATVKHARPHTWLFPWLPYLPQYHLDPKASSGFLVELKRRLRQVLDGWNVSSGVLPGLLEWRDLLRSELDHVLVRHLLPKLARYLSMEFEVDPADQDLTALENVFKWEEFFKTDVYVRLLVAEFFPKWHSILHLWLTSDDPNFDEILQWLTWWQQQIPEKYSSHPDIVKEWDRGKEMAIKATELQDEGRSMAELAAPAAGPSRPIAKEVGKKLAAQENAASRPIAGEQLTQDFRDVVEAWCAEEDLTMVPLREAHPQSGAPLFRITASATGKGGVIVYLKGDIVWAQKKADRSVYEPIGLDEKLVDRAEGK